MGDYRTTTGEAPPLPPRERRRRRRRSAIAAAAATAAIAALGAVIRVPRMVGASGYIASEDYAEVRPSVEGAVAAIHVRSGERVEAGTRLVDLDDREARAALEEARTRLRRWEAEVERRAADAADRRRQREHEIAAAALRLRGVESRLARQRELAERGLAAASAVEEMELQRDLADAELRALQDRDVSLFEREVAAARFEAEAARETAALLEAQWSRRRIVAPIAGLAVRHEFSVGEFVRPDQLLYEIYGGEPRILKARIPERDALRVAPGQPYVATLTSYGGWGARRFEGRVEALRPVISAEGLQTYRVVYCAFDPGAAPVPAGTTAEVRIRVGRVRFWAWLLGLD